MAFLHFCFKNICFFVLGTRFNDVEHDPYPNGVPGAPPVEELLENVVDRDIRYVFGEVNAGSNWCNLIDCTKF